MAKGIAQFTITAVYDGEDAQEQGAIKAILSNEYHNIPAEYDGTPKSLVGAETSISVYEDLRNVTSEYTITKVDSHGIVSTIEDTNKIKITGVTNGTGGTVSITAIKDDIELTKVFTVNLVKETSAGANDAPLVSVTPSDLVFISSGYVEGPYLPSYIQITCNFTNCSYSKWQYSQDNETWEDIVSGEDGVTVDNSTHMLQIANNSSLYTVDETAVTFRCLSNKSTYDEVTINRIFKQLSSAIIRSAEEPDDPSEGMLWFDTANGVLYCYHANAWVTQDMSSYATESELNNVYNSSNQVFVSQPLPTYKPGDMWIVQDEVPKPNLVPNSTGLGVTSTTTEVATDITITVDSETIIVPSGTYTIAEIKQRDNNNYGLTQISSKYYWALLDSNNNIVPNGEGISIIERPDITVNGNTIITVNSSDVTVPVGVYQTLDYKEESGEDYFLISVGGECYWVTTYITDFSSYNGKILTCVAQENADGGSFNISDWIVPLDAYTTVTQMENVIGKDPTEWSTESKSITTLINENTNAIVGQQAQSAKLAVRASDIEMSFSKTGTMNFLGNSSGQNGLEGWTLSTASLFSVESTQDLVSGYSFKENGDWGNASNAFFRLSSSNNIYAIPPAGDTFTLSLKVKNASKFSFIYFEAVPYDSSGHRLDDNSSFSTGWVKFVPYADESESEYILEHIVCNKSAVVGMTSLSVNIFFCKPSVDTSITTLPEWNDTYINKLIKIGSTYYYGSCSYLKMNVVKSNTRPEDMTKTTVWYCTNNVVEDGVTKYVAAVYYRYNDEGTDLVPITDNYDITMLDKDSYYRRIGNGWEDVTSYVDETSGKLQPQSGAIYFGDIMLNGGQMVQTWTPRQDENLWGENIKFNANGITIKNIPAGYSRTLDSSSDIAYQLNGDGSLKACIWKLTQTGFITQDIKCWGSFSMGAATNALDVEGTFVPVMQMKRTDDNSGVDEYIFS